MSNGRQEETSWWHTGQTSHGFQASTSNDYDDTSPYVADLADYADYFNLISIPEMQPEYSFGNEFTEPAFSTIASSQGHHTAMSNDAGLQYSGQNSITSQAIYQPMYSNNDGPTLSIEDEFANASFLPHAPTTQSPFPLRVQSLRESSTRRTRNHGVTPEHWRHTWSSAPLDLQHEIQDGGRHPFGVSDSSNTSFATSADYKPDTQFSYSHQHTSQPQATPQPLVRRKNTPQASPFLLPPQPSYPPPPAPPPPPTPSGISSPSPPVQSGTMSTSAQPIPLQASPQPAPSPSSSTLAPKHACQIKTCTCTYKRKFELERHMQEKHGPNAGRLLCPVDRCPRSIPGEGFDRMAHLVNHLVSGKHNWNKEEAMYVARMFNPKKAGGGLGSSTSTPSG